MPIDKKIVLLLLAVPMFVIPAVAAAQQRTGTGTGNGTNIGPSGGMSNGSPSLPPSQQNSLPSILPNEIPSMADSDIARRQERLRNADRQKQLVLDTQKLLALANELKTDVDKSTKNTLSLDVVRKADEIEKLAHAVKEKMKGD